MHAHAVEGRESLRRGIGMEIPAGQTFEPFRNGGTQDLRQSCNATLDNEIHR